MFSFLLQEHRDTKKSSPQGAGVGGTSSAPTDSRLDLCLWWVSLPVRVGVSVGVRARAWACARACEWACPCPCVCACVCAPASVCVIVFVLVCVRENERDRDNENENETERTERACMRVRKGLRMRVKCARAPACAEAKKAFRPSLLRQCPLTYPDSGRVPISYAFLRLMCRLSE